MTWLRHVCLWLSALGLLVSAPAHAQERVALVVGNGAYQHHSKLLNPLNDSADMAGSLRRLGFTVTEVKDAGYDSMRRALIEFGRRARASEMAVVFFAGHGIEVGGENWLIPVDAQLKVDADAENEAIGLRNVMGIVEGASKLGLVILDACRDNPFAAAMQRSARTRSVARGLARVEPTGNVLVAYAAKDGTTSDDGDGRNSPFTRALLKHMETPGLEVQFLFRSVRDDVMTTTRRVQQPYLYGSLSREEIYFKAPSMPAGPPTQAGKIALLIGNADYAHISKLVNPRNDVATLAAALRQAGFTSVRIERDLTKAQMTAALSRFANEAATADTALVYYAGSGFLRDGKTYVTGTDAKISGASDLRDLGTLDELLQAVRNAHRLRVVVADVCQDDSIDHSTTAASPAHPVPPGTLALMAASPGQQAFDGPGSNSPFSAALAKRLVQPGLAFGDLARFVRDDVLVATDRKQEPRAFGGAQEQTLAIHQAR